MEEAAHRSDGRAERSRRAILDATRDLLGEKGDIGSLTIEAVAARSGVAKTTIYRRWRDKWELALDAVMIDMLAGFTNPVAISWRRWSNEGSSVAIFDRTPTSDSSTNCWSAQSSTAYS